MITKRLKKHFVDEQLVPSTTIFSPFDKSPYSCNFQRTGISVKIVWTVVQQKFARSCKTIFAHVPLRLKFKAKYSDILKAGNSCTRVSPSIEHLEGDRFVYGKPLPEREKGKMATV